MRPPSIWYPTIAAPEQTIAGTLHIVAPEARTTKKKTCASICQGWPARNPMKQTH